VVLVAGGTGGTGSQVVRHLLADGRFDVRVLARNAGAAAAGDKVQAIVADVRDPATLAPAMQGVTYVVSAIGSNQRKDPTNTPEVVDYGGTRNLVETAKAAGVQHFVLVSSQGVTDVRNPLNQWLNNILVWKYLGEESLRRSGLKYTVVRPGGLTNDPGTRSVVASQGDNAEQRGSISRDDVGLVCAKAVGNPDAFGKTFEVAASPGGEATEWSAFFKQIGADPAPQPMPARR
jgi:uncharacterized protein YbjT (DUF2867 family)